MKQKYIRKPKAIFYVEETDLFAGDMNYSWCNRYLVTASTCMGATRKASSYKMRLDWTSGDEAMFKNPSGLTGCYVLKVSEDSARELLNNRLGIEVVDDSLLDKLNKDS